MLDAGEVLVPGFRQARALHAWTGSRPLFKDNPQLGAIFLTNVTPATGALPIMLGEEVIGAAGVSGAPGGDKDEACVKAALDKVADQLK